MEALKTTSRQYGDDFIINGQNAFSILVMLKNGKSVTLIVNGDTRITGETEFGRYETPLRRVARITSCLSDKWAEPGRNMNEDNRAQVG